MDTPNALKRTMEYLQQKWPDIEAYLSGKERFVFLGCGSSYSLARSMAVMTLIHTGLPSFALAAGDLLLHAPRYEKVVKGAAVICISRSGKTSEMIMALDAIKPFGVSPAALICADGTPLEERCDLSLNMPWAYDDSICQTRAIANFYFAASWILAKKFGDAALVSDLEHYVGYCQEYLSAAESFAIEVAALPWTHCVVVGDAELEGIADEGALAFKEICQLPSNYYHILDARHGPMVLFGEKTLVIAALGEKDALELDFLSDVRKRNATAVAFSDTTVDAPDVMSLAYGRKLTHIARGLPFILLCQLISLHKARHVGVDPDSPTGLNAWISLTKKEGDA